MIGVCYIFDDFVTMSNRMSCVPVIYSLNAYCVKGQESKVEVVYVKFPNMDAADTYMNQTDPYLNELAYALSAVMTEFDDAMEPVARVDAVPVGSWFADMTEPICFKRHVSPCG